MIKFLKLWVNYAPDDEAGGGAPNDDAATQKDVDDKIKTALDPEVDDLYGADGGAKKVDDDTPDDDKDIENDDKDNPDDDDKDKDDEGEKPADLTVVPEDGQYHIEIPKDMEMDQELLDEMQPLWKEKGLTHTDAQELVNKYVKNLESKTESADEQREGDIEKWAEASRADKEIGGDKIEATIASGRRAISEYGSDKFAELLDTSGLGSHPEVLRFMSNVGNTLTEDSVPNGDPAATNMNAKGLSDEEELYGTTTPLTRK